MDRIGILTRCSVLHFYVGKKPSCSVAIEQPHADVCYLNRQRALKLYRAHADIHNPFNPTLLAALLISAFPCRKSISIQ